MSPSDPYDFSDFGPGRGSGPGPTGGPFGGPGGPGFGGPGGPGPRQGPGGPPGAPPGGGFSTGFDPFGGAGSGAPQTAAAPIPGRDLWGNPATPAGPTLQTAGPPMQWLAVAMGLAIVGLICTVVGIFVGLLPFTPIAGWLLAGPIAIGALAVYSRVDTKRRSEAVYSGGNLAGTLYWAVLALCVIGIGLGAWQLALWAGRL